MTWTNIPNEDVAAGAPLSTALMTALRDNGVYAAEPFAVTTGALDLTNGNYFSAGVLDADATLSFSNVRTATHWTYAGYLSTTTALDIDLAASKGVYDAGANPPTLGDIDCATIHPYGLTMWAIEAGIWYELSLSTPFDASTATLVQTVNLSGTVSANVGYALWKPDGTKCIIWDDAASLFKEVTFSTPFDIGSTVAVANSYDPTGVQTGTSLGEGSTVSPDGLHLYASARSNTTTFQFDLAAAWDLSSVTYNSKSWDWSGPWGGNTMQQSDGMVWSLDGTSAFVGFYNSTINSFSYLHKFSASTPFDITTLTFVEGSFSTTNYTNMKCPFTQSTAVEGLFIYSDTGEDMRVYSIAPTATVTLPVGVVGGVTLSAFNTFKLNFSTVDGGTTILVEG